MHELPAEWGALAALVFVLGLKHGFDPDHLATIDGLTRFNRRAERPWARYCGALFSLGHGSVVIAIAAGVGLASERWEAPRWLEESGAWISLLVLAALGMLNLRAVLATPGHEMVAPVGMRSRMLGWLSRVGRPALVALVGALFAISFDTVSQATLFAVTATRFGGLGHAVTLGLLFTFGMLVTDGINGLWVSRLIARADRLARVASRVMGLAIAVVSLLVAAFGAARMALSSVDGWSDGHELAFGIVVVGMLAAGYLLARALAVSARAQSGRG